MRVRRAPPEQLALPGPQAIRVPRAQLARPAAQEPRVRPVPPEPLGLWAQPGRRAQREPPEQPARPGQRVQLEARALLVQWDLLVRLVPPAGLVPRVHWVPPEPLALAG
jgi:hypothetical protein